MNHRLPALIAPLLLVSCQAAQAPGEHGAVGAAPGDLNETAAFAGIGPGETVRFTGTEPFWGGHLAGSSLTYSTPENPAGDQIAVQRFDGRGGASWSGTWQEQPFRLAISEAACSDGMSDRRYPFTATLQVRGEQRQGCAWTDRRPATGGEGAAAPTG